jgi:hypothetical protein
MKIATTLILALSTVIAHGQGALRGTTLNLTGNATVAGTVTAAGFTGPLTGTAATATALATARNINGTAFDGTANITVTAAAGTLTGGTLAAGVTASSLQTFGTLGGHLIFTDNTYDIGASGATRPRTGYYGTSVVAPLFQVATGVNWRAGSGSPEGAVTAEIGSLYSRTDGGTDTAVYRKESGSGNTGWVAVAAGGGSGNVATDAIWDAKGDLAAGTGANTAAKLSGAGITDGYVLTYDAAEATGMKWAAAAGGSVATDAIWDAAGDLAVGTGANTGAKLSRGTALQVLRVNSGETALEWASAGAGDVVGPASATDSALVVYDGTTGKLLKNGLGTNATTAPTLSLGTVTDTTNRGLTLTQTWNNAGLTASAFTVDVTNTNSAAAAALASFRVGGSNMAYIRKDGYIFTNPTGSAAAPNISSIANATGLWMNGSTNVGLSLNGTAKFTATATTTTIPNNIDMTGQTLTQTLNFNGAVSNNIVNASTGGSGHAYFRCANSANESIFGQLGTGYTTSGGLVQNSGFFISYGAGGMSHIANNASGAMRFYTGGVADANERIRILSGGNVGIGTTAADKALEVNLGTTSHLRLTYNDGNGSAANYVDYGTSSGGNATIAPSSGIVAVTGRVGTTTQSLTLGAAATTAAVTSNVVKITGDAGGNTLGTITGGTSGMELTIIFVDALVTITDDGSATANTVNLSAAWTSTAGDTLTLIFDGTSWFETGRSVN